MRRDQKIIVLSRLWIWRVAGAYRGLPESAGIKLNHEDLKAEERALSFAVFEVFAVRFSRMQTE
jgi:hypothetical protein